MIYELKRNSVKIGYLVNHGVVRHLVFLKNNEHMIEQDICAVARNLPVRYRYNVIRKTAKAFKA